MKLLRHERMVELAFEGHRLWDLRRWNLAVSVLNGTHMKGVKPVQNGESFVYEIVDCDAGKTRVFLERQPLPRAPSLKSSRTRHVHNSMNGNKKIKL